MPRITGEMKEEGIQQPIASMRPGRYAPDNDVD